MNKKLYFAVFTTVIALIVLLFWPRKNNKDPVISETKTEQQLEQVAAVHNPDSELPKKVNKKIEPKIIPVALKSATAIVATQYEAAIQYPAYSQPLNESDHDRLNPNSFFPVSSPIGDGSQKVTLQLGQYYFIYPEPIELSVSGPNLQKVAIEVSGVELKKPLQSLNAKSEDGVFKASIKGSEALPRELQLKVLAQVDNKIVPVIAQVKYMQPSAELITFAVPYSDNDAMALPAKLEVYKSGVYRLRANLFNGNTPLAHLVAKLRLEKGAQTLPLKAHWSVFNASQRQLNLRNFQVELMSPKPGVPNQFGRSQIESFDINDFQYDSLQQLPYQATQQEQQRLDYLTQLANP